MPKWIEEFALSTKNGGISSARNAGLDVAEGEYVLFVDGDDYVDVDYVSYFLNLIVSSNCDIAMNLTNYTYKNTKASRKDNQKIIDSSLAIEYIYTGKIFVAVWNKIYKKTFLVKNQISFDTDYWYGEGMLFNITCLQYVDQIAVGSRNVYHQVFNPDSAMRSFNLESNHCGIRSLFRQKELWSKKNKKIEDAWNYHYWCFSYTILCGLIKTGMTNSCREEYQRCLNNIRSNRWVPFKVDIGLKNRLIFFLVGCFPVLMAKRSTAKDLRIAKRTVSN